MSEHPRGGRQPTAPTALTAPTVYSQELLYSLSASPHAQWVQSEQWEQWEHPPEAVAW